MTEKGVDEFFEDFLSKDPLFVNKSALQSNYTPEEIPHREEQKQQIAKILAPALRMERPSNLFLYGKTGTGKTCCVKHIAQRMEKIAKDKGIGLRIFYVNCKLNNIADTEYRLIAYLAREFGKEIPKTGIATGDVYQTFYNAIDKEKQIILLVLDEIDQIVSKASELLYNLTRINSEIKNAQIAIIGISNDLVFADNLDPRVKSSLSEEELVFPPYNALQIQDILTKRTNQAFRESAVQDGVIQKCAAYAAKDHGDARRALELMRVAGELAEREGGEKILIKHLDQAEDKIEHDRILDVIITQPELYKATLYAALSIKDKSRTIYTGDIYSTYQQICEKTGLRVVTQRRVSDIIAEFDMLGILNAKVISKGRYGRTREITVAISPSLEPKVKEILVKGLGLN